MHHLEKARKRLPGVQVNAVYGPDTIAGIPENLDFFIETGLDIIHFNPDIKANWPESLYPEMPDIFRRAADRYIEAYQNGREIAVNLFDAKIILFLKGGYSESHFSSMGHADWGIAPGRS
jgi:MoaA/NifB/PqqE/SkfB family radical SAM enzyme